MADIVDGERELTNEDLAPHGMTLEDAERLHRESMINAPEKSGYMTKEGANFKTWKRRWFVLKNRTLLYYEDENAELPLGNISLHEFKVDSAEGLKNKALCFQIWTPHRTYYLRAETQEDFEAWQGAVMASRDTRPTGWLTKQGINIRSWKRRWFVLNGQFLLYYADTRAPKPLGIIPLGDSFVEESEGKLNYACLFQLAIPTRIYYLRADNRGEMERWMNLIRGAVPELYNRSIPSKRGWLWKKGKHGVWSSRYFQIMSTHMYYFKDSTNEQPRGTISLRNVTLEEYDGKSDRICSFALHKNDGETFILSAENRAEQDEWMSAIRAAEVQVSAYKATYGTSTLDRNAESPTRGRVQRLAKSETRSAGSVSLDGYGFEPDGASVGGGSVNSKATKSSSGSKGVLGGLFNRKKGDGSSSGGSSSAAAAEGQSVNSNGEWNEDMASGRSAITSASNASGVTNQTNLTSLASGSGKPADAADGESVGAQSDMSYKTTQSNQTFASDAKSTKTTASRASAFFSTLVGGSKGSRRKLGAEGGSKGSKGSKGSRKGKGSKGSRKSGRKSSKDSKDTDMASVDIRSNLTWAPESDAPSTMTGSGPSDSSKLPPAPSSQPPSAPGSDAGAGGAGVQDDGISVSSGVSGVSGASSETWRSKLSKLTKRSNANK